MTNVLTWSCLHRPVSDLRAGVSFDKARACHAISIYYYQFYSDEMPLQDLLTPVSCALLWDVLFQGQAELGGSIPLLWCAVVHQNKVGMVVIQGVGWALDIVIWLVVYETFTLERGVEMSVLSTKPSPCFNILPFHFCAVCTLAQLTTCETLGLTLKKGWRWKICSFWKQPDLAGLIAGIPEVSLLASAKYTDINHHLWHAGFGTVYWTNGIGPWDLIIVCGDV